MYTLDPDSACREVRVESESETIELARRLANAVLPVGLGSGIEIGLCGELGVGKTTLVRHMARALGVVEQVSSPSYVLQHEYRGQGKLVIEHWDLYRLTELPDDLNEPPAAGVVRFVEWADRNQMYMQKLSVKLFMHFADPWMQPEARSICIESARKLLCEIGL